MTTANADYTAGLIAQAHRRREEMLSGINALDEERRGLEARARAVERAIQEKRAAAREAETVAVKLGGPAWPTAPTETVRPTPGRPARGRRRMTRCGLTPGELAANARRYFGSDGFTVNEFVARSHWERTPTRVEGVRQLLQELVAEGAAGRASRCDSGYRTEVEYTILGENQPPGAQARPEVLRMLGAATADGWRVESMNNGAADHVRVKHPVDDTRFFLAPTDPRGEAWRSVLKRSMRRVGAPITRGE